jgi:DNA-binding response OmpR family regulator
MNATILLLLVEDEPLVRMNLQEELSEAGFELVVAANSQQAIAELEVDSGRFRGVLTDIRLGRGADGWEVARRARELSVAVPVVYISGDSAHEWLVKGVPNSVMVSKPFVAVQIITAISTLLNNTSPPETTAPL